ncbi:MAG: hypothetical protein JW760_00560 [Spirochaetales bacterium]|nr:hypothetical protein [Spirochaetales bacterium]
MAGLNTGSSLLKSLRSRGSHRTLGNSSLGTFSAFLTLLVAVRIAANLYIVIDLYLRGSGINIPQVFQGHAVFLAAYLLLIRPLAAYNTASTLPWPCFIDFTARGKAFRSRFSLRAALFSPMTWGPAALLAILSLLATLQTGLGAGILGRALFILAAAAVGFRVVLLVLERLKLPRSDLEVLTTLYLIFLVMANPDLGPYNHAVSFLYRGFYYFPSSLTVAALVLLILAGTAAAVPFLFKGLSLLADRRKSLAGRDPLLSWYRRVIRPRTWIILYGILASLYISPFISQETKRRSLGLALFFGAVMFVFFLSHCDNALQEKWRRSLLHRKQRFLILRPLAAHSLGMAVCVLGYLVSS